jgi:aryl-alcohol dehydrogenase-like predicted oxidoreductase
VQDTFRHYQGRRSPASLANGASPVAIRVRPAVDTNVGIATRLVFLRNQNLNNLALVESVRAPQRSVVEVAIAWRLGNLAVSGAVVGARNAPQAEGVMSAGDLHLTENEVNEIEAFVETAA